LARLLLVRHGETEMNSSLRYWGRTDVALGAVGKEQAERLCKRLSREKIDTVYSSDLARAMTTARIIASAHNPEVTPCPDIREINYGRLEGLTFEEIDRQYPEIARLWIERSPDIAYPGGESIAAMDWRVASFLNILLRHSEKETVLVVSHSGFMRNLICRLMGFDPQARWSLRLDLASLSIIDTYREGAILSLLNDTCHLEDRR
jgi:alpha-ribazole phosphatase